MTSTRFGKEVLIGETTFERIDNVRAHFIATCSRGGTDSHAYILRLCFVFRSHAFQRLGYDLGQRAAPAGMNGGESARLWVANQNGHAVSRLYTRQDAAGIADNRIAVNSIAVRTLDRLRFGEIIYETHVGAVNLPAAGECPLGKLAWEKLEKAATILQNVFRSVFIKAGKIECVRRHRAGAAHARGKPIGKTSRFEWRADERLHAFKLAPVKTGSL